MFSDAPLPGSISTSLSLLMVGSGIYPFLTMFPFFYPSKFNTTCGYFFGQTQLPNTGYEGKRHILDMLGFTVWLDGGDMEITGTIDPSIVFTPPLAPFPLLEQSDPLSMSTDLFDSGLKGVCRFEPPNTNETIQSLICARSSLWGKMRLAS